MPLNLLVIQRKLPNIYTNFIKLDHIKKKIIYVRLPMDVNNP